MATNDYSQLAENLFEAVQTIYAEKIKTLDYNKTIKCSIIDDLNAELGEYTVSDGSAEFIAYSETKTYKNGNCVYVLIPNNDYNQQKTIVGKYVTVDSEHYTYVKPSDSFVNITENMVDMTSGGNSYVAKPVDNEDFYGLTANAEEQEFILYKSSTLSLGGFNRMAIKADFKTWLGSQNLLEGNYGIAIDIITIDAKTTQNDSVRRYYTVNLDSDGFYGNPYNFENFYSQEAVVDISSLTNNQYIYQFQIRFYQKNNFVNEDGKLIIPSDKLNIFVKNFEIHFGYALENFSDESVLLYTLKGDYYATYFTEERKEQVGVTPDMTTEQINRILNQYNQKDLHLRWVHRKQEGEKLYGNMVDGNDFISIDNISMVPETAAIHWYQYDMREGVYDDLAGAFWREITPDEGLFSIRSFTPDITKATEKFRAIIEYPCREEIERLKINDRELMEWQRFVHIYEEFGHSQEIFLEKLTESGLQHLKDSVDEILLYYNGRLMKYEGLHRTYHSEVLVFTNECPTPDPATIDLIQGLSVEVDAAGYNGVYRIYKDTGEIMNNAESNRKRLLTATYKSLITGQEELDTAEKITWIIPTYNTMIYPPEDGVEYDSGVDTVTRGEDGEIEITRLGVLSSNVIGAEEADTTQQYFRIKDYYNQSYTNNSIVCKLVKNNISYEYVVDLIFGPCGTHGTDYTLTLEFQSKEPAATVGETAIIVPHLYDYDNNDITNKLQDEQFVYSWYSKNDMGGIELVQDGRYAQLTIGEDIAACEYYILKLTLKNVSIISNGVHQQTVTLTQVMPIPVRINRNFIMFEGADKIAYNTSGVSPDYYKNPYRVYGYRGGKTVASTDVTWKMSFGNDCTGGDEKGIKFYPQISNDGKLTVPSLYLQDNGKQIAVHGTIDETIVWTQPLYLYQYVYDSTLLNSWTGDLTMDEENGTILSAMMGAGKKDGQNRFHGVLMGDISKSNNIGAEIGLYGYHEGQQSFGFTIDGKAFIGKNTKGQILMDGNSGRIQSLSYQQGKTGMLIDLDDGKIDIRGARSDGAANTDESSPSYESTQSKVLIQTLDPYLTIDTENGVEIMRIGSKNYYLKSENYDGGANRGTKFDIAKGELIFYDVDGSNGYVRLRGNGSDYFRVNGGTWSGNKDLIYISGEGSFFIQSANYQSGSSGMRLDLKSGSFATYKDGGGVVIDGSGHPYFQVRSTSGSSLINIGSNSYFLQSENFASGQQGVHIDLNRGRINAYSFELMAQGSQGNIVISSDGAFPLHIYGGSGNFQVGWDGSLVTSLFMINSDGSIKMGNFFLIDSAGAGYLSGWNFNDQYWYSKNSSIILDGYNGKIYTKGSSGYTEINNNGILKARKATFQDCYITGTCYLGMPNDGFGSEYGSLILRGSSDAIYFGSDQNSAIRYHSSGIQIKGGSSSMVINNDGLQLPYTTTLGAEFVVVSAGVGTLQGGQWTMNSTDWGRLRHYVNDTLYGNLTALSTAYSSPKTITYVTDVTVHYTAPSLSQSGAAGTAGGVSYSLSGGSAYCTYNTATATILNI